ncbi:bis-aminopropyl spermidine synthase family protein [Burkholderia sp. SIMBA_062]|uniref:bis-aminopropyl spermidine synthase family protein n=1 Tax=Burkholderia sp. SIMBA_062 TaxID=3085803 RepID=UPI003978F4CA
MTYMPLPPNAAAAKIQQLVTSRGTLTRSELVFFGGMTDAAVQRGIQYLRENDGAGGRELHDRPDVLGLVEDSGVRNHLKVGIAPLIGDLETYERALKFLEAFFQEASGPDHRFNQNFVTPDTSVRRIMYAATRDTLKGKRLYFLGDDDLTGAVAAYLYPETEVFVMDIDARLLSSVEACAKKYGLGNLKTIVHNAFDELPAHLHGDADVVWCDPSKAVLDAFLRNASALIGDEGVVYTFAQPEYLPVSRVFFDVMLKYGMIATDMIPRFNQYCASGQHSRVRAQADGFELAFTESLVRLVRLSNGSDVSLP